MPVEHCEPGVIYGRARYGDMAHILKSDVRRLPKYIGSSWCGVNLIHAFDPHHEPVCYRCMSYRRKAMARDD